MEWMRQVSDFPFMRHSSDMVPSPIDGTTLELPRWIWQGDVYGVYVTNSDWFGLKWALHPESMTQGFNSDMPYLAAHAWCSRVALAMVISAHSTILTIMHLPGSSVTASAIIAFVYWSCSFVTMLAVLCSVALLTQYTSLSACDAVHP